MIKSLPAYKATKQSQYCLALQPRRALGGQLKNRPGTARASASFSPTFHVGSFHTRDASITQYEIAIQKYAIRNTKCHCEEAEGRRGNLKTFLLNFGNRSDSRWRESKMFSPPTP